MYILSGFEMLLLFIAIVVSMCAIIYLGKK